MTQDLLEAFDRARLIVEAQQAALARVNPGYLPLSYISEIHQTLWRLVTEMANDLPATKLCSAIDRITRERSWRPAAPPAADLLAPAAQPSVLQDWATALGPRHQSALLSAVRGADEARPNDPSRPMTQAYRATLFRAGEDPQARHSGFLRTMEHGEFQAATQAFVADLGTYRAHYLLHFLGAAEVVGHHHPSLETQARWQRLYLRMCMEMNVAIETRKQFDERMNRPFGVGEALP